MGRAEQVNVVVRFWFGEWLLRKSCRGLFEGAVAEDLAGAVHDDVGGVEVWVGAWGCMRWRGFIGFPKRPGIAKKLKFTLKSVLLQGSGVMEWWSDGVEMRIVGSWNGCIHWLRLWFSWFRNGLEGAPGFRIAMAEKEGTWVITKKVFSASRKNHFFLLFLTIAEKRRFRSIKTGVL